MHRRIARCLLPALAFVTALAAATAAFAQSYPSRAVRLIVPFPPGGPADQLGRALADQLTKMWGQPVIIENRGGAGGNLGAEVVALHARVGGQAAQRPAPGNVCLAPALGQV